MMQPPWCESDPTTSSHCGFSFSFSVSAAVSFCGGVASRCRSHFSCFSMFFHVFPHLIPSWLKVHINLHLKWLQKTLRQSAVIFAVALASSSQLASLGFNNSFAIWEPNGYTRRTNVWLSTSVDDDET